MAAPSSSPTILLKNSSSWFLCFLGSSLPEELNVKFSSSLTDWRWCFFEFLSLRLLWSLLCRWLFLRRWDRDRERCRECDLFFSFLLLFFSFLCLQFWGGGFVPYFSFYAMWSFRIAMICESKFWKLNCMIWSLRTFSNPTHIQTTIYHIARDEDKRSPNEPFCNYVACSRIQLIGFWKCIQYGNNFNKIYAYNRWAYISWHLTSLYLYWV